MNKKYTILLILILMLGVFLRFYNLDKESFWLDEGATGLAMKRYTSNQILENIVKHGQILPEYYDYDDDLPVYYLSLRYWADIFGMTDYSLRVFSALFGALSLVAIFILSNHLFGIKNALLTTFLSSTSMMLIWYSQDARQYSFLFFLSIVSIIFLLKLLEEGKMIHTVGFISASSLIIFTQFSWLIFIAFEGIYSIYYMCTKNMLNKKIIACFLIIIVLYLLIIGRALTSKTDMQSLYGRPDFKQISKLGLQISGWIYPSESMANNFQSHIKSIHEAFDWMLLFFFLVFVLISAILFISGIIKSVIVKSKTFALFMVFIPLVFALLLSYFHPTVTVLQIKQVIYVIPAFLMLVSEGCLNSRHSKVIIIILIVLMALPICSYYINVDKEQFREALNFLPKDKMIFTHIKTAQVVSKYYYGEDKNVVGIDNIEELKPYIKDKDSFWFLFTALKYSRHEKEIKGFIADNYTIIETKHFFGIDLVNYKHK